MIKILNVKSLYSALFKAVEFCKDNEKEQIEIIVPDKLSLFMEKFLFEKMEKSCSFNIKVSTLNRFAKKSCLVEKDKQISKVGSILLIHKILNDKFDMLEVLRNKAYSFSYAEDIFRTIEQLKASKITFEEMKKFMSDDVRLAGKIKDLAMVYEEYELGKSGLLDASDLFLMSTLNIASGKENKKLLFIGFDDFTAIEYAIIERLAMVAEVNVFNYSSTKQNKHLYNSEVVEQLKNIAYINQLPYVIEDCEVQNKELQTFLEDNLFSLKKEKHTLNKEWAKVFSGSSIVDELEFVARDIRFDILNGGQYKNYGVAVYNLETHINKIKEIFEKYEINYYIDSEMLLTKSVLYKFFANILRYNLEGYSLTNLIDLINSPFFAPTQEEKRKIVQKMLDVNFRGKVDEKFNLDIEEELKQNLIAFIKPLLFDRNAEVGLLIEKLKLLSDKYLIDEVLLSLAGQDVDNKTLLIKSKEIIFNLFDDILRFNPSINAREFFDIFIHISTVVKINNLPLSLDVVKIVDANNTMEIFENLYIVNATHDNAPNLKYDCGIILDNEIEKLNFKHKLSPTISHINKLSKLRLYNASLLFEKELTVTYSNSQSELVKDLLDKLQIKTVEGIKNIVPFTRFDYDKYVALSEWDYVEFLCKNKIENNKYLENNKKIIKNKENDEISHENLNIFNNLDNVSATTLENYFKCPLYAFLQNILKIQPRMKTEILALDIGNVLHEIMYEFYKRNKLVGDIYEFCKTEVFKHVNKVDRLKLNMDSPILTNLIDEAVRVVNAINYIDNNSLFQTNKDLIEKEFKGEKSLKLKNISIIGKVDRIDVYNDMFRIVDYKSGKADASLKELYFGNKLQLFLYSLAMEKVLKKKSVGAFYLPLHNAYRRELDNPYAMKGFYLAEDFVVKAFDKRLEAGSKSDIVNVKINKQGGITKTQGYKELEINQLNDLKKYAQVVSENAVDEIKSGYIKASPSDVSKPCEFCPYLQMCLRNSNAIEYRNSFKVNLESFKEVEDEEV